MLWKQLRANPKAITYKNIQQEVNHKITQQSRFSAAIFILQMASILLKSFLKNVDWIEVIEQGRIVHNFRRKATNLEQ